MLATRGLWRSLCLLLLLSWTCTAGAPTLAQVPPDLGVQPHRRASRGLAEDTDLLAPGDHPAESFFDVFFEVRVLSADDWTNDLPDRYRTLANQWPPNGTVFPRPLAAPTVLFDPAQVARAEIIDGVLEAENSESDLDGLPDYADNYPFAPNPGEEDFDADDVGNPCDLCPLDPDPEQQDRDADGLGDACDPDIDGDGFDNHVDCVPFSTDAAVRSQEVLEVQVSKDGLATMIGWPASPPPGFTSAYDVIAGDVGTLTMFGGYDPTLLECVAGVSWSLHALDVRPGPAPGEAALYLVRQRNICGVGTFGDSGLDPDPRDELDLGGGPGAR